MLDHAVDQHPFAEREFIDHRAGHEGVGAFSLVVIVGVAEKAIPVGMQLEDAAGRLKGYRLAIVGLLGGRVIRAFAADGARSMAATATLPIAMKMATSATTTRSATTSAAAFLLRHVSPR